MLLLVRASLMLWLVAVQAVLGGVALGMQPGVVILKVLVVRQGLQAHMEIWVSASPCSWYVEAGERVVHTEGRGGVGQPEHVHAVMGLMRPA